MDSPETIDPFEAYRPLLFSIAYRMLGSAMEAEDMVQETYLRYQATPKADIRALKPFLTTITTRLCLDQLKSAREKRETYIGPWLPEPLHTDSATLSGDTDTISMAFLVLLESLTPPERAVFLLREVFDYGYDEIGAIVGKEESTCRQLFSRAKRHIAEHRPRFTSTREQHDRIFGGFIEAIVEGKLDDLTHMLAEDVTWYADGGGKTRASTRPVAGRAAVAALLKGLLRHTPEGVMPFLEEINGKMGVVLRMDGKPYGVLSVETDGEAITALHFVVNPDKLRQL
jgi:RNA polymerase sigma-70 factor, ECF subfamily